MENENFIEELAYEIIELSRRVNDLTKIVLKLLDDKPWIAHEKDYE